MTLIREHITETIKYIIQNHKMPKENMIKKAFLKRTQTDNNIN